MCSAHEAVSVSQMKDCAATTSSLGEKRLNKNDLSLTDHVSFLNQIWLCGFKNKK